MLAIKQVFVIAGQNFAMWKRSPRVWLTFIIGFVMCLMLSDNVISYAQRYENYFADIRTIYMDLWGCNFNNVIVSFAYIIVCRYAIY